MQCERSRVPSSARLFRFACALRPDHHERHLERRDGPYGPVRFTTESGRQAVSLAIMRRRVFAGRLLFPEGIERRGKTLRQNSSNRRWSSARMSRLPSATNRTKTFASETL